MRHPGQVLSRQQILNGVWGYTFDPRSNLVDVYVGYLRRKLTTNGRSPIETVRGMGYRMARERVGVKGGLAIRTRLAIVSATLAVGSARRRAAHGLPIDRRQVDQSLAADARSAARDLAGSGQRTGRRCRRNEARERRPPRDRLSPGSGRIRTAAGHHPAERLAPGEQPSRAAVVAPHRYPGRAREAGRDRRGGIRRVGRPP